MKHTLNIALLQLAPCGTPAGKPAQGRGRLPQGQGPWGRPCAVSGNVEQRLLITARPAAVAGAGQPAGGPFVQALPPWQGSFKWPLPSPFWNSTRTARKRWPCLTALARKGCCTPRGTPAIWRGRASCARQVFTAALDTACGPVQVTP